MTRCHYLFFLFTSLCITIPAVTHAAPTPSLNLSAIVPYSQLERRDPRSEPRINTKKEILGIYDRFWIVDVFGREYFDKLDSEPDGFRKKNLPIQTRIGANIPNPEGHSQTELAFVMDSSKTKITDVAKGFTSWDKMVEWEAYSEVKVLQKTKPVTGLYSDHGRFGKWPRENHYMPVILMKYVEGTPLVDHPIYVGASEAAQQRLRKDYEAMLAEELWHIASRLHIVHADIHQRNVLVDIQKKKQYKITKLTIIDWGYPGVFTVLETLTKEQFIEWFPQRFDYCNIGPAEQAPQVDQAYQVDQACQVDQADKGKKSSRGGREERKKKKKKSGCEIM
ncbi:hypothetical protein EV360DRAFT_87987 [Lentinula raphanica]|nr:hypothetical protein EV360DRAFT_87987 [Lentinula raphanica]